MKSVRRYSLRLAFQCALFLLLVLAANGPARAQGRAEVAQGEYQVYNAVLDLMQFPKRDAHIIIADTTLNRRCGGDSGNPVLVNNCGIWAPPSSAEEIFRLLRDSWPKLGKPTWDDLVSKSSTSSTLQDKLTTPWAHRLVDVAHGAAEEGWKTPDGAVFLSRVGLSGDSKEAIVYVLFFSYMDSVPTAGDFFIFRRDTPKSWSPVGRITYMQTQ
jgi:hypothetical protein